MKYNELISEHEKTFDQLKVKKEELKKKDEQLQNQFDILNTNWYKINVKDEVDQYIGSYCNSLHGRITIQNIQKGIYQIGTKKVHFMLKKDDLYMRRGAGIAGAHKFLDVIYQKS